MSKPAEKLKKAFGIIFHPEQHWRIRLFFNRKLLDLSPHVRMSSTPSERALDALVKTAQTEPAALELAIRKLQRKGQTDRARILLEEVWPRYRESSASVALLVARQGYASGQLWLGDEALRQAKHLAPDWSEVFQLEARNQAWRGNVHVAIEAAKRVLELNPPEADSHEWNEFLGKQYFKLQNFSAAAEHFEQGISEASDWKTRYQYAVALEELELFPQAEAQFARAEQTAVPGGTENTRRARLHLTAEYHGKAIDSLQGSETEESLALLGRAQLFEGDYSSLIQEISAQCTDLYRSELRALALELAGDLEVAERDYLRLARLLTNSPRTDLVLNRLARVSFRLGHFQTSLSAGLRVGQINSAPLKLDNEPDPAFSVLTERANEALILNDVPAALACLARMKRSCSTLKNFQAIHRLYAFLKYEPEQSQEAANALFAANPSRLPFASECNRRPAPLSMVEAYSDAWETLPLDNHTILYESFHGTKTSCNPLAICRELLERKEFSHLHHVWVVKDGAVIHPSLLGHENVHFVQYASHGYAMHLATAGYLVNNTSFPHWFLRREGQRYANTWHGIPWKHLGSDVPDDPFAYDNIARNMLQATDLLLPNEHTARILTESHDISELIIRDPHVIGSPRVDLTLRLDDPDKKLVGERLGIVPWRKNIFFAPTWRGIVGKSRDSSQEFIDAINILAQKNANIIVRVHHFVADELKSVQLPANVYIASQEVDTNEILAVTDILVSDYSSLMFDFAPRELPIVKYVFDYDEYARERGVYFPIEALPGSSSYTLLQLSATVDDLLRANLPEVADNASNSDLWSHEDGNATNRAIEILFSPLSAPKATKPAILLSIGGLNPNGITRSLQNLLKNLPKEEGPVQIFVPRSLFENSQPREMARELRERANFTLHSGLRTGTRQEQLVWRKFMLRAGKFSRHNERGLRSRMQRECRLYFGDARLRVAIDFDGHFAAQAALFGFGFEGNTKNIYVAHNEFRREMEMKFPAHRNIGETLRHYDVIASVSDSVCVANAEELANCFDVPEHIHVALPNTIDAENIRSQARLPLDEDIAEWFAKPGPHLVIAGRFSPEKNHESAIRALKLVHESGLRPRFLLLGDGPFKANVAQVTRDLGLEKYVFFTGQRGNPYSAFAAADGLLLPSLHEGQGLVLIEAMALGTPVAATDIPGPASVLHDESLGLLVAPTVEGIAQAISALSQGEIPFGAFDADSYQRKTARAFLDIID